MQAPSSTHRFLHLPSFETQLEQHSVVFLVTILSTFTSLQLHCSFHQPISSFSVLSIPPDISHLSIPPPSLPFDHRTLRYKVTAHPLRWPPSEPINHHPLNLPIIKTILSPSPSFPITHVGFRRLVFQALFI